METLKISYDYWEREITDILIDSLEISNGDAQALVEANNFLLMQSWAKDSPALEVANKIMEL